jgi:leucyl-tRNA synthetase
MDLAYNHQKIEQKWQKEWEKSQVFKIDENSGKEKKYVLDMFPYPSGAGLHVGHPEGYTATDIYSRYLRMKGYEVIHPLGWDAFGLPAENYAIKIGVHPQKSTTENIANFTKQIKSLGFSYDWDREINTSSPEYYKWSQWFFLLLYKNNLAYQKKAPVNWCESCQTVLANEQVVDGKCERCHHEVIKKDLKQWFFKVTAYADELLEGLDKLEWSPALKAMQRNWIGKSEGGEIEFQVKSNKFQSLDIKKLYFATGNKSKLERLKKLFEKIDASIEIEQVPDYVDVEEDGKDAWENSLKKAEPYRGKYDVPVLSMDTAVFFSNEDQVDPLAPKRSCLGGADEKDLSQEEIAEKALEFYKSIAQKNGGEKEFYYEDFWTILYPDGEERQIKNRRDYVLTDQQAGNLDIYFPMKNLYYSKVSGKRFFENTDEDYFKEFECQTNALKELILPKTIKVFTTRPDTLYGATYMVLAPEHHLVQDLQSQIENFSELKKYIDLTKKKSDLERTDLNKDKSGVELKGITAINPVNGKELPIYISDYVLASYGTGAIMCVPAHDQRDFEFAQKFNLPIVDVVQSERKTKVLIVHGLSGNSKENWFPWIKKELEQKDYKVIIPDMSDSERPVLKDWLKELEQLTADFTAEDIIIGHSLGCSATMNLVQKTNLKINKLFLVAPGTEFLFNDEGVKDTIEDVFSEDNIKFTKEFLSAKIDYKRVKNNVNKIYAYFSDNDPYISLDQKKDLEKVLSADYKVFKDKGHFNISEKFNSNILEFPEIIPDIIEKIKATEADGKMINSEEFNGMDSEKAQQKITKKVGGELTTQYKLRDWLVSRQRYWGAPIPIVHCEKCGAIPVPEKDLPVVLPNDVKDFRPTGKPPLALSKEFNQNVKCPQCGGDAIREHDTMDGFVDNSWYYYRYLDPQNEKEFCAKEKIKKYMPVDTYVGGTEHAVGHLIYSRFFTKVLRDNGYLNFDEPFLKLINQGLIMGTDGQKMSKSLGNVVNPDEVVKEYGADSFRMYEMFMGPLEDSKPWNIDGIKGLRRFLDKNWRYFSSINYGDNSNNQVTSTLHKTIKKVTEDIEGFRFNTAISSLMVCFKELSSLTNPGSELINPFLIMLATFAPHLGEEIWQKLGNKGFICQQEWPKYNEKLIVEDKINLPIQINGKLRATLEIELDISEGDLKKQILELENIQKFIEDKEVIKFIYIKNKIVNIVVK